MKKYFISLIISFIIIQSNIFSQNLNQQSRQNNLLPPYSTIGNQNPNYYIDSSGRYVYYGKPLIQKKLNITYNIDGKTFSGVNFSIRYFFTPRIIGDDLFDNVKLGITGANYRGELSHDYRFLKKGYPYIAQRRGFYYLPRTFIRLEIETPEGTKYLICPSLDKELVYPIKPEQITSRAKLIISTYTNFRSGIYDIMLYERIRYSTFSWITLKKSKYKTINTDKIIWHYYRKEVIIEQHFSGYLNQVETYFKKLNLNINKATIANYYKANNYLRNPLLKKYYVLKFRLNNFIQYIIVPVSKTYHNVLNRPIKELITYFARKYLNTPTGSRIIIGKEFPPGRWQFINAN